MGQNRFILANACIYLMMGLISILTHVSEAQNSHQDFVNAHNAARARVGVGPIHWNYTIAAYAQNYANKRIKDCNLEHSMGPYSENLAGGWSGLSAVDAVKMWVDEKKYYNHQKNSCIGDECRHYTQIVWRDTVHLGCARVRCKSGGVFVICDYDPPGNNDGQRPY